MSELMSPFAIQKKDREMYADFKASRGKGSNPFLPPTANGRRFDRVRGLVKTSPFALTIKEIQTRKFTPLPSLVS